MITVQTRRGPELETNCQFLYSHLAEHTHTTLLTDYAVLVDYTVLVSSADSLKTSSLSALSVCLPFINLLDLPKTLYLP